MQVVAVKAMAQCSERLKGTFMKEVEVLKLVSRVSKWLTSEPWTRPA